jgi:hypothetical protein
LPCPPQQVDFGATHGNGWLLTQEHHFLVDSQPGEAQLIGKRHQLFGANMLGRFADTNIDAGIGGGESQIAFSDSSPQRPGNIGSALEGWNQDRTGIQIKQVMAFQPHIARAILARMQGRPATAFAMGLDKTRYFYIQPSLTQRAFNKPDLEGFIACRIHMLKLTTATGAEMWTEGICAIGRGREQIDQRTALPIDGESHLFTRQGEGHEDALAIDMSNTLALMAEAFDSGCDGHGRFDLGLAGFLGSGFGRRNQPNCNRTVGLSPPPP